MWWIVGIIITIVLLYLLDREIYFYEGTHLGPRVQGWLYDRWARKYDLGKKESQLRDSEMLAKPVLIALEGIPTPLVLDLATGTGRLPLALLREPDFDVNVFALDVSTGMLEQAAARLENYKERITLLRLINFPLPFPDSCFDLVCCMEALEVMPEMETPLRELFRVLKPGGMLLTSRATDASGRRAKVRSLEQFSGLLHQIGFEQVEIIPWWRWFDRVTARKPGDFLPAKTQELTEVLKCPKCGQTRLNAGLLCQNCGAQLAVNPQGIILY